MRSLYRGLALTIPVLVGVQAASHAWASAGMGVFVTNGGVVDQSLMESGGTPFPEVAGFMIHGINGMMVIPLVALSLFVVSFFARFPGAVKWAAIVLGLVALQVTLGMLGHGLAFLGLLHGFNALLLASAALYTQNRARAAATATSARVESRVEPANVGS